MAKYHPRALPQAPYSESPTILNGHFVTAGSSQPGIGGADSLLFSGRVEIKSRLTSDSFPVDSESVLLSSASVTVRVPTAPVFGRSPTISGASNLSLLYGAATWRGEEPVSGYFLQIGRISFPAATVWNLRLYLPDYERILLFNSSESKSLIASLQSAGNYRLSASSESANGHIEGSNAVFAVDGLTFVADADFVPAGTVRPTTTDGGAVTTGRTIGLILGITAAVGAVGGGIAIWAAIRRRRKAEEEEHTVELLAGASPRDGIAPFLS
jgi:hypothetical protein